MADVYFSADCKRLLHKKRVVLIGDSNVRAIYKDLLCLLGRNTLIPTPDLRRKCEQSCAGDRLVRCSKQHQGRDFFEIREYKDNNHHLEFVYVTRCINKDIEDLLQDCLAYPESAPDVIVMNSCLWDISRWGPNGVPEYRDNLIKLLQKLNKSLPAKTLFIWTTTLPLSLSLKGGFLVKQVEFLKHTIRYDLMEANVCAHQHVVSHGYDVLDFHYYFRMQTHRRSGDGIHWGPEAVRFMTNLLLTHISLSLDEPLPGRRKGVALENIINYQSRVEPVAPALKLQPQAVSGIAVAPLSELRDLQRVVELGGAKENSTKVKKAASEQKHTSVRNNAVTGSSRPQRGKPKKGMPRQRGRGRVEEQSWNDNRNQNQMGHTDPYYGGPTYFNQNQNGGFAFNGNIHDLWMEARRHEDYRHRMRPPTKRFQPYQRYY